jgi:hypothetical protein
MGVGELQMDGGARGVFAAIHHATGAWIHELPASPERILAGLGVTAPPGGPSATAPAASGGQIEASVDAPIEAGTDPRPGAPTDPQVLRGPRDPGEPA